MNHYFNKKGVWTCVAYKTPTIRRDYDGLCTGYMAARVSALWPSTCQKGKNPWERVILGNNMSSKLKSVVENLDSVLDTLEERLSKDGVATTYRGVCGACEESIHGEVFTAFGKTWHPDHFACYVCDTELSYKTFYERDGKPYCEKDYNDVYAPKCFDCNEPVVGPCITCDNRTWHPDHFVCAECKKPFDENGFHEHDEKAYCEEDYIKLFRPKCPTCNEAVVGITVNKRWHPECFNCAECNHSLEGRNFYEHEGKPYCETHFRARRRSVCHACKKLILRQCITAMGNKYHPEHFTCSYCGDELNGPYKEANGKAYCERCHLKTFGVY